MELSEKEIVDIAVRNSYNVIIGNMNPEDLITTDFGYFVHDIMKPIEVDEIKFMLDYFIKKEEYEKCTLIQKLIDKMS